MTFVVTSVIASPTDAILELPAVRRPFATAHCLAPRRRRRNIVAYLRAGPATDEVEDQNDHGNNQKQVNEAPADAAQQAEKPENSDNDGYPKQHE